MTFPHMMLYVSMFLIGKEETYLTPDGSQANTVLNLPGTATSGPSPIIRSLGKSRNLSMSDMGGQGDSVTSSASTESGKRGL